MTLQSEIRVCLVVILVWQIGVHWSLCTRGWTGWDRLGKGRRRKESKRDKEGLLRRLRLVMGYYNLCRPTVISDTILPRWVI